MELEYRERFRIFDLVLYNIYVIEIEWYRYDRERRRRNDILVSKFCIELFKFFYIDFVYKEAERFSTY